VNVATIRIAGETSAALSELIALAKERFAAVFSGHDHDFDALVWPIKQLRDRSTSGTTANLYFTRYGTLDQPLPTLYAEVVKSWLILELASSALTMSNKLGTARVLWEAILTRLGGQSQAFKWEGLCEEDLRQAENIMCEKWSLSTAYKRAVWLGAFAEFLASRLICRPLSYSPQTPRIEDSNRHTIAGQEERMALMPSKASLEGLADIYQRHAKEPPDRLRACALAILVVTGFRVNELLTLPEDCEVKEVRGGKQRYGVRYYKEKTRGGEKMFDVRWLTPAGAELACQAIAEIREITRGFRQRARLLEKNPGRVPIPGHSQRDRVSPAEAAQMIGLKQGQLLYESTCKELKRHRDGDSSFYRVAEIEAYLLSRRVERLWTLDRRDGTYQMLSESLFIVSRYFFHSGRNDCPLLIDPVTEQHISDFISGGKGRASSVFERFGITEPDGALCRVRSHQLRHWLNSMAEKGGLPLDLQTRWMGRENPRDTDAYRHLLPGERAEWVKEGIRTGEMFGSMARVYFELPADEKEDFLEGQIQIAHITPMGLCLRDLVHSPCQFALNCLRGCSDYLRVKGDQGQRQYLVQIQRTTERALALEREISATGNQASKAWIREYEETLDGVRAALAIDNEVDGHSRTSATPFKRRPSKFKPA
jgi:hypothetical protein